MLAHPHKKQAFMPNPWTRKNPFMSMWLSAANKSGATARGKATGAARRQIATAQADALRQVLDFWAPQAATPRPRKQGTTLKPRPAAPRRSKTAGASAAGAGAALVATAKTLLAAGLQ